MMTDFCYSSEVRDVSRDTSRDDDAALSEVLRCSLLPHKLLQDYGLYGVNSLYSLFRLGLSRSVNGRCLGRRTLEGYEWLSYDTVDIRARRFATGLLAENLVPQIEYPDECYAPCKNLRVLAIFADNCPEWVITDVAAAAAGITVVPLYPTMTVADAQWIIEQTQVCTLVTWLERKPSALEKLLSSCPSIQTVILLDRNPDRTQLEAPDNKITIRTFSEIEEIGSVVEEPLMPGLGNRMDDPHMIRYTSGTTGRPKGVIETHRCFLSSMSETESPHLQLFNSNDVYFSLLPLAHLLDHSSVLICLASGGAVGFGSGNLSALTADVRALKPTIMAVVPRIITRLVQSAEKVISRMGTFQAQIIRTALGLKISRMANSKCKAAFLDVPLRPIVQEVLGGQIHTILTAGAPITETLYRKAVSMFSISLIQAYGMTECMMALRTYPDDVDGGFTVGGPSGAVELRFRSVPELNADASAQPPSGELLVRGSTITPGYFRNAEATAELLQPDGWLRTGDVAGLGTDGRIRVYERVKDAFKLAQGKYITPAKIEEVYALVRGISQCFVDGNPCSSHVVGVVVPNLAELNLPQDATYEEIKAGIEPRMREAESLTDFAPYEKLKHFVISYEPFTVEEKLLTPTSKPIRRNLRKKFRNQLDALYTS